MLTYFIIAARNLVQARRRTLLMSSALGLVTALMVTLLALSQGVSDTMQRSATLLMSGHVNIAGWYKAKPTDANPLTANVSELRKLALENSEGVDYIIDRQRGFASIISETDNLMSGLAGIDVREESRLIANLQLAEQREYKEDGTDQVLGDPQKMVDPNTAMLFAAQAKRLGVQVGDSITLSATTMGGQTNTAEATVVAIAKNIGFMSNWTVFVSKQKVAELYQLNEDTTGAVMLYLKDPTQAPQVMANLREVLTQKKYDVMPFVPTPYWEKFETVAAQDWVGQRVDLTTWSDELGQMMQTVGMLDVVSGILLMVLFIIIIVGIMNTMWMSVRERTSEVGTLRAIGMGRPQVLFMFVIESLLLGLFATGFGALFGLLLANLVDAAQLTIPSEAMRMILMSDVLHLVVSPAQLIRAVVTLTLVTVVASMLPAIKAALLRPVTAIHHAA